MDRFWEIWCMLWDTLLVPIIVGFLVYTILSRNGFIFSDSFVLSFVAFLTLMKIGDIKHDI